MIKVRYVLFFLTIIFGMLMIVCKTSNAQDVTIPNGIYTIKSAMDESLVLDITGASKDNIANLEIWKNNGGNNQKFEVKSVGDGYYTLRAVHSSKYLDVEWASKECGANIQQYGKTGGDNQIWLIKPTENGYFYIVSKNSGLYMDVENAKKESGANVLTWVYNGGLNQQFKFEICHDTVKEGVYKIASSLNTNYVLDIEGGSKENNANLELWINNNGTNQMFRIKKVGDGSYTISPVHSGKKIDVYWGKKNDGTNIDQYDSNNGDNQKWYFRSTGNGNYCIISKCSGLYMDIDWAKVDYGTNILTWSYNHGANQEFKLIPIDETVYAGRSAEFKREHPEIKVGIDVSRYQGNIDWNAVKNDGIDYVMVRAGFRGYGQSGTLNEDTKFEQNVVGAREAGLDVGVYFFSQAKSYEEGVKEAEYTLDLIRRFDINYPIAFDTEESSSPTNSGRADNISVQSRTDATRGFCETIENAGYDVLIYASSSWLKEKLDLSQLEKYNIWLANYTGATQENPLAKPSRYKGNYVMWQYTDSGTVNGINGGVDCDIYYYLR